jgi:glycosyltransferase involved in cell wall biosynthesis
MSIAKILYIHYQRSDRDGSFVHTREFESAFGNLCAEKGIAFKAIHPRMVAADAIHKEEATSLWARFRRRLARFYLRDLKSLLLQWRRMGEEMRLLKEERPDIVLTRFDDDTLSILWACRRLRIPAVVEINSPERDGMADDYRRLPWVGDLFTNHHALSLSAGAFTVSEQISEPLRRHAEPGKPVHTIANGVDIRRFDPNESGRALRERLGIAEDRIVLGFVGSFAPWHGLDMLVDAFATLLGEGLPVHLLLVGQPHPKWAALLQRIQTPPLKDHVSIAGFVQPKDIPHHLAAMDITVLANAAYYCSPLKLFEYMAMARPTVAADTGPVAATLADGREGLLFPQGQREALTDRLRRLVLDPEQRRRLGEAARRRMETEFTWRHNAERVFDLLETAYRFERK